MRIEIRAVILMTALAAGCTAAPRVRPVKMGPADSTLEGARKFLEGRWTLMSYEVFPPGKPSVVLGPSSGTGTLTYDAYSNLDIQIRVTDQKAADALDAAGIPLKDGVIATTGRTAIDLQNHTLTYLLEGQGQLVSTAQQGPLAFNRPRYWQVEGDVLVISTKDDSGKPLAIGRWKK
jgi:hypothetical protein